MGTAVKPRPATQKIHSDELTAFIRLVQLRSSPLIRGTRVVCPGCETEADLFEYHHLEVSSKYADQVVPPLKCKTCRHVFAMMP